MSFNLKTFFSVFNSVGCLTAIFFVFLLVDRLASSSPPSYPLPFTCHLPLRLFAYPVARLDFLFRNNKFQSPFLLCVSMVAIFLCGMIRTTPEKVHTYSAHTHKAGLCGRLLAGSLDPSLSHTHTHTRTHAHTHTHTHTHAQVEFMSQELTNEWKGWMILSLVAINYSGMEQVCRLATATSYHMTGNGCGYWLL